MSRIVIASNRLPLKIEMKNKGPRFSSSEGGLATGLNTVHKQNDNLWIGWPGIASDQIKNPFQKEALDIQIREEKCEPVWLTQDEINTFYSGFSNQVLWPLFHYFTEYVRFDDRTWGSYKQVNRKFADKILEYINKTDLVWIHDYQMMLVPQYLRRVYPDLKIGFFLHIPFPSYEIFKILPVREEMLNGMLGSDLIGFHTFGYQRHFLISVQALTPYEVYRNIIRHGDRSTTVDVFPMGIDVTKFYKTAKKSKNDRT